MLYYKHNEILVNARLDLGNKKKLADDMLKNFFRGANETHVRLLLFHDHF